MWYVKSSYLTIFIIVLIQQNIHNTCIKHELWMLYFKAFKWCLQEARRRFDKASQLYDQVLWKLHNIIISASIFFYFLGRSIISFWVFSMILYSWIILFYKGQISQWQLLFEIQCSLNYCIGKNLIYVLTSSVQLTCRISYVDVLKSDYWERKKNWFMSYDGYNWVWTFNKLWSYFNNSHFLDFQSNLYCNVLSTSCITKFNILDLHSQRLS